MQNNIGNSFKDLYYTKIQNGKEISELEYLYKIMCDNPSFEFCSDQIADIFGNTNIASRLFNKLQVNNLIICLGGKKNKNGTQAIHYKVLDANKRFSIKKEIALKKEVKDVEKEIHKIIRFCINPDINYASKKKILNMTICIIDELGKGKKLEDIKIYNLFSKDIERMYATEYLDKIVRFVENYRK